MGTQLPQEKKTQLQLPLPERDTVPNFRPICCGRMAGWIKMPLGMEVGLGPGDFVLDGTQLSLSKKGAEEKEDKIKVTMQDTY